MHYAMLVYYHEPDFHGLPDSEQTRLRTQCAEWQEKLARTHRSPFTLRLEPTATATTLRARAGGFALFDGPFAETKETLGGLVVLDAPDLDAALDLARTFPALPAGFSLELRPVTPVTARRPAAS